MKEKSVIVFTFPNCMGGVSSFNRNIINFYRQKHDYRTRVILLNDLEDERPHFDDEINADEVLVFDYSYLQNQRTVIKRLSALLGNEEGCIVTENSLTLNTIRQMGTSKNVVHLVHDMYYINLALEYRDAIDACVVHSSFFKDVLLAADIAFFQKRAFYIPYGVEPVSPHFKKRMPPEVLRLVFIGRLVEEKGGDVIV
jgi:glycosyltransferase involved in cell wall biosynthesis